MSEANFCLLLIILIVVTDDWWETGKVKNFKKDCEATDQYVINNTSIQQIYSCSGVQGPSPQNSKEPQ